MSIEGFLVSGELLDDAGVDEILDYDAQEYEHMDSANVQYIAQRKKLLGPASDVTHPEFGRPNRPEETFVVYYKVKENILRIFDEDDDGNKISLPVHKYQIDEYIIDNNNNLVSLDDL